MKRFFVFFSALILTCLFSAAAFSAEEDEQWNEPSTPQDGHFSIVFKDSIKVFDQFSLLQGFKNINGVRNVFVCTNVTVGNCADADVFQYNALLPACADSAQLDCIESLSAISISGSVDEGTFSKYIYKKHPNSYEANVALKIPKAESPSIWSFSKAKHAYGAEYAIAIGSGTQTSFVSPQSMSNLFAYLYPVSVRAGVGDQTRNKDGYTNLPECIQLQIPLTGVFRAGCAGGGHDGIGKYNCPLQLDTNGDCLLQHEFPTGYKFQVSIRLSTQPSGWLYGRLLDPLISISGISTGGTRVVVTALPTKVPAVYAGDSWNSLPKSIQDYYLPCIKTQSCQIMSRQPRIEGPHTDPQLLNAQRGPEATEANAFNELKLWLPIVEDTMAALPSAWNFKMSSVGALTNSNACFRSGSGLKGIVTTNATLYSEAPPILVDTTLQYKVAAPHYKKDGSEFKGTYNLVIRSDVARCIYGFSNAPIQASIDVVSENGTSSVATTAVSENNGWISLSAYNFGFSAPTIKATLKQEALISTLAPTPSPVPVVTEAPVPTPTSTPKTAVAKKTTITCIKGKLVKKVTAVKPACPKGYKKR